MESTRLQELAGIPLTESKSFADLQKQAREILTAVNKFHGDIVNAKRTNKVGNVSSLEEALYRMSSELDKFTEK